MKKILAIVLILILAAQTGAAEKSFSFDINETDANEYNKNAIPILNEYKKLPKGTNLSINDEPMNRDKFMWDVFYPNHPTEWLRIGHRVSEGGSSKVTYLNDDNVVPVPISMYVIAGLVIAGLFMHKRRDN